MQIQTDALTSFRFAAPGHFQYETPAWRRSTRETARQLVQAYGYNSTSYFALGKDKHIFIPGTGQSLISYALQRRSILALGDPIGPEHALPLALKEFLLFCRQQGKIAAFWQARAELLPCYRAQGLHALKIGEDAMLDVQHFVLKGKSMANVRSSVRRAEKERLQVVFFRGKVTDSNLREQMKGISQRWLVHKGGVEMDFSMGQFEADGDDAQFIACAIDERNNVHAFVSFVPIYGRNGWALDLLRRKEDAVPGAIELLLVRSLEYLKALNVEVISLGLAPLNNSNGDSLSCWNRWGQAVLSYTKLIQPYETLNFFKKKFHPHWENRYLVFSHRIHLPRVARDLYQAHYPGA